jgi:hypothetical protein
LDGATVGGILVEGQMDSRPVVVTDAAGKEAFEKTLSKDDHVIQVFPKDEADCSFCESVLPRRSSGSIAFRYAQRVCMALNSISIEVAESVVARNNLSGRIQAYKHVSSQAASRHS